MLREVMVRGERILYDPQTPGHNVHVASRSETGRWHHVDDETGCECAGFRNRHACRHIEAVIALNNEIYVALDGGARRAAARFEKDEPSVYQARVEGGLAVCVKCGQRRAKVDARGVCPLCMTGLDD